GRSENLSIDFSPFQYTQKLPSGCGFQILFALPSIFPGGKCLSVNKFEWAIPPGTLTETSIMLMDSPIHIVCGPDIREVVGRANDYIDIVHNEGELKVIDNSQ